MCLTPRDDEARSDLLIFAILPICVSGYFCIKKPHLSHSTQTFAPLTQSDSQSVSQASQSSQSVNHHLSGGKVEKTGSLTKKNYDIAYFDN